MFHDCRHVCGLSVRKDILSVCLLTTLWSPSPAAPRVLLLDIHRDIEFHEISPGSEQERFGEILSSLFNAHCF